MFGELSGQVHGAQGMLKAAMFRGGEDPARALQLVNIAEPLHPGRVYKRFFRYFAFGFRNGKLNIAMDRVGDERRAAEFTFAYLCHGIALHLEDHLRDPLVAGFLHMALVISHRGDLLFDLVAVRVELFAAHFSFDHCVLDLADIELL